MTLRKKLDFALCDTGKQLKNGGGGGARIKSQQLARIRQTQQSSGTVAILGDIIRDTTDTGTHPHRQIPQSFVAIHGDAIVGKAL